MRIPTGWSGKVWFPQRETSPLPDRLGESEVISAHFRRDSSARYSIVVLKSLLKAWSSKHVAAMGLRRNTPSFAMSQYFVLICMTTFSYWARDAEALVAPITDSRKGYTSRVEYVKAVISKEHLDSGTRPSELADLFFRKLRANGKNDVAGQLVPERLGGTGLETENIAPMNKRTKTIFYKEMVEDPIYTVVSKGATVVLEVWPRYEGNIATRPNRFEVNAAKEDGTVVVDKVIIPNPTS